MLSRLVNDRTSYKLHDIVVRDGKGICADMTQEYMGDEKRQDFSETGLFFILSSPGDIEAGSHAVVAQALKDVRDKMQSLGLICKVTDDQIKGLAHPPSNRHRYKFEKIDIQNGEGVSALITDSFNGKSDLQLWGERDLFSILEDGPHYKEAALVLWRSLQAVRAEKESLGMSCDVNDVRMEELSAELRAMHP